MELRCKRECIGEARGEGWDRVGGHPGWRWVQGDCTEGTEAAEGPGACMWLAGAACGG